MQRVRVIFINRERADYDPIGAGLRQRLEASRPLNGRANERHGLYHCRRYQGGGIFNGVANSPQLRHFGSESAPGKHAIVRRTGKHNARVCVVLQPEPGRDPDAGRAECR